jgi:chorismate dehydratase
MTARIGMVKYINTAPIYEIWKEQVQQPDWAVTEAPPAELNRLLAAGAIDIGCVSSYEYAVRPDRYQIMADLSISATGPVGSVFLFSALPPEQLGGQLVLLTGQSDTSACLLRIILEEFLHVRPQYVRGEIFAPRQHDAAAPAAVLAIGDEALRLNDDPARPWPLRFDLGECWHQQTGLPFVFAVFAVREDFLRDHAEEARAIRETLLDCRSQGLARLPEICHRAAPRIPMSEAACRRYFQSIEYDLSPAKQQALERFISLLARRGEADQAALPLKIFA